MYLCIYIYIYVCIQFEYVGVCTYIYICISHANPAAEAKEREVAQQARKVLVRADAHGVRQQRGGVLLFS